MNLVKANALETVRWSVTVVTGARLVPRIDSPLTPAVMM